MGIIKVPVQPEVAEVWFFRHYGEGLLAEKWIVILVCHTLQ